MPTCRPEIQELMDKWFPLPENAYWCQDRPAMDYLQSHGWVLNKDWTWTPPVSHHTQSFFEYICITYLIEEWDFGGEKNWLGKSGKCYCKECLNDITSTDNTKH